MAYVGRAFRSSASQARHVGREMWPDSGIAAAHECASRANNLGWAPQIIAVPLHVKRLPRNEVAEGGSRCQGRCDDRELISTRRSHMAGPWHVPWSLPLERPY